jgi:tetratricopeptide (TPR) repeat protein
MPSRLQSICDALLEAVWLTALIAAPLFFNVYSQRVFEPDKIALVRSLAWFALIVWIVKQADGLRLGRAAPEGFALRGSSPKGTSSEAGPLLALPAGKTALPLWRRPLALLVLALAGAYLLSTALSVAPRQSLWGSYQRLQGTLSMLSYMVLFLVVLDTLRTRGQWRRLQYTVILVSVPIALYGILQHYRLDPLPWGGDTTQRVASNMGNAIFVAAYLIMAVPLTLERLINATQRMLLDKDGSTTDALTAGTLLFVLVIQLVAIVFTQSRGPWLGLAAGLYVFLLLALTSLRQRAAQQGRLTLVEIGKGVGIGVATLALVGLGLAAVRVLPGLLGILALGLAVIAALALFLVPLLTRRGWRWLWLGIVSMAVAAAALLVLLNVPNTPLAAFKELPYVGRLGQMLETDEGTGKVRTLIWEGVVAMLEPHGPLTWPDGSPDVLNPVRQVVGYGPESMWVAYNRFYVPALADLEARNASPDRSHNETFDSLVTTGFLGFLVYIILFSSIFYYALKWLGLVTGKRDRNLFIVLAIAGGLLGVGIPAVSGHLNFAGVGVALGFILGVLVYVTVAAFRGAAGIERLDRRQLVIIALLATVLAHFVEIHFGISIASTRTYFFVLVAALVAVGIEQVPLNPAPSPAAPAPVPVTASTGGKRRRQPGRVVASPQRRPVDQPPLWRALLPYTLVVAIVLFILDWDFLSNQTSLASGLTVFWRSWVTHLSNGALAAGPGALWIVLFTLFVGITLALGETWSQEAKGGAVAKAVGAYLAVTLSVWLAYGLYQANRLLPFPGQWPVEVKAAYVAGHITGFYVWLALLVTALAASLVWLMPAAAQKWSYRPLLAGATAIVLVGVGLFLVNSINLNLVRADMYFKLAQTTDSRGEYATSLVFYDKISEMAPNEDYYQLFRGRSLLEAARASKDATQQRTLLDRAEQVLLTARNLNPLNTDHSANLARYYGTIAATMKDPTARDGALRTASDYYAQATALSPNAAHLQNEWGTVYAQLGEDDQARARFARSLQLDPYFADTYLRRAQLALQSQDWEAAAVDYEQASKLSPTDVRALSGRAYALAQLGRTDEAIAANLSLLGVNPNDLSSLQNLAILFQKKGQFQEALTYAQQARDAAPEAQRSTYEALVQQLQKQLKGG